MTDPREVANSLSEAQRRAMVAHGPGKIPNWTSAACRCALQRRGLVVDRMFEETLTPLGEQVRAILTEESPHGQ